MIAEVNSGVSQSLLRPERPEAAPVAADSNRAQPEPNQAGRTSEAGSGVTAEFSAAAMELARPATAPEQQADTNRSENMAERENSGVAQANREEQARQSSRPERYSSLDIVV